LRHPHIAQIYEIGGSEDYTYLALDFIGGGTLAQKLKRDPPSPRAAADIVAKLARAVQHAHEQGVLHRDLKPANVLLTSDGQPTIADFGLAKMLGRTDEESNATMAGTILGTPSYMSPEQAAGNVAAIGPPADIFGLGCILYESLTGRPPFRGTSVMETLSQLMKGEIISPETLNPAVDRGLSAVCLKCLEHAPANRYQSAADLANDLERWLQGTPIVARSQTLVSRWVDWCGKALRGSFLTRKREKH
jgi:serine/threonine protein kinase